MAEIVEIIPGVKVVVGDYQPEGISNEPVQICMDREVWARWAAWNIRQ